MDHTWCTKENVLKDLEAVSGQRVADVSEGFFVIGQQPPPPRMFSEEDDEIELRFGRAATTQALNQDNQSPDLKGITKMLRMVQDYENSSDEEARTPTKTNATRKIVISKLNPNVKEFIPKNAQLASSQNVTISTGNALLSDDSSATKKVVSNNIKGKSAIADIQVKDTKMDEEKYTKENKKQIANMLRNQISVKEDSFISMRQTNSAIVNLLKLYAKPEPKNAEPVKCLKLLTPQFFENCKASDYKSNIDDTNNKEGCRKQTALRLSVDQRNNAVTLGKSLDIIASEADIVNDAVANDSSAVDIKNRTYCNMFHMKNDDSNVVKHNNEIDYSNEATCLTPDMADASVNDKSVPTVKVDEALDPHVAESINKVNNWFDDKPYVTVCEKEKPKGPALYLGTVAYKRKDPVTCKSPSDVADKKISKSLHTSYQPSSYAEELIKKYKERNVKKVAPTLNIWEKLEEDLKKKDNEIKNRKP